MLDLYPLARNVLFRLDAETAHHVTLRGMVVAHKFKILRSLAGVGKEVENPVELMGLTFPNRVGLAAGMDKGGTAVDAFGALGFGHVEIGTVTPRSQPGNPKPRLFRLVEHEAVINRMGFNNPGTAGMLSNLESSHCSFKGVLGINIGKNFDTANEDAIKDYLIAFEAVYDRADYVTVNLSSPNTKGLRDLQNAETCRALIEQLQSKRADLAGTAGKSVPLVIKIAPDLDKQAIQSLAEVFSDTAIDGVITTNTTIDRQLIDGHALAQEAGGLSGAPLTEASTEILALLRKEMDTNIPIIASGGVMAVEDAREKFQAGAALVQIYTGLIYSGPALVGDISDL